MQAAISFFRRYQRKSPRNILSLSSSVMSRNHPLSSLSPSFSFCLSLCFIYSGKPLFSLFSSAVLVPFSLSFFLYLLQTVSVNILISNESYHIFFTLTWFPQYLFVFLPFIVLLSLFHTLFYLFHFFLSFSYSFFFSFSLFFFSVYFLCSRRTS